VELPHSGERRRKLVVCERRMALVAHSSGKVIWKKEALSAKKGVV
jgi:hypothetical protein